TIRLQTAIGLKIRATTKLILRPESALATSDCHRFLDTTLTGWRRACPKADSHRPKPNRPIIHGRKSLTTSLACTPIFSLENQNLPPMLDSRPTTVANLRTATSRLCG